MSTMTSAELSHVRQRLSGRSLAFVLGLASGFVSMFLRPSYDETYWLGVARLVENGRTLYEGAIDNKTPVVYAVTWLLDVLPGPYSIARGLLVGLLVGLAARLVWTLAPHATTRTMAAAVAGATLALASDFVLTTELPAVAALLGALAVARRGIPWAAMVLAVAAAAFDPRAVILFPGVLVLVPRGPRRNAAVALAAITAAAVTIVLVQPDLRYGLVEMNLASRSMRGGWNGVETIGALTQSALPLAFVFLVTRLQPASGAWWLSAGALLIGISSVHGFPHYWAYLIVPFPLLVGPPRSRPERDRRAALVLLVVSVLPSVGETVTTLAVQQRSWSRYEPAAESIDENERIVVFELRPYLATLLASQNLMRSPTLQYVSWENDRRREYLEELSSVVSRATTILDTGALEADEAALTPELRPIRQIFLAHLPAFPCRDTVGEVVIRRRAHLCDDPSTAR